VTDALMIRLIAPTLTGKKKPCYEPSNLLPTKPSVHAASKPSA